MGGERDVAFGLVFEYFGKIALVQFVNGSLVRIGRSDFVEQVDKMNVALPEYLFELDADVLGFLQGLAAKEINGWIHLAEHFPFLFLGDGGKLMQVAYHKQLQASKGNPPVSVAAQNCINRIKQVGPHHADFIYH